RELRQQRQRWTDTLGGRTDRRRLGANACWGDPHPLLREGGAKQAPGDRRADQRDQRDDRSDPVHRAVPWRNPPQIAGMTGLYLGHIGSAEAGRPYLRSAERLI